MRRCPVWGVYDVCERRLEARLDLKVAAPVNMMMILRELGSPSPHQHITQRHCCIGIDPLT